MRRALPMILAAVAACGGEPTPTGDVDAASTPGIALTGGIDVCLWHADLKPGCQPELELRFPGLNPGETASRRLVVRNLETHPVTIEAVAPVSWLAIDGNRDTPVAPGDALLLEVRIVPGIAPGAYASWLQLSATDVGGGDWSTVLPARALIFDCKAGSANTDGDWINGCESPFACPPWHYGILCEPCPGFEQGAVCTDHGLCEDGLKGTGVCFCDIGWTGADCSIDIDECKFEPCHQMAVCENFPGTFSCTCEPGWIGTGFHCSPAPCSPLEMPNGSDLEQTAHGVSVKDFVCEEGYAPVPDELPRCEYGEWIVPVCTEVEERP